MEEAHVAVAREKCLHFRLFGPTVLRTKTSGSRLPRWSEAHLAGWRIRGSGT